MAFREYRILTTTYDTVMKKLDDWAAIDQLIMPRIPNPGEVMSVEFFGVGGPGQIGNMKKSQKVQTDKKVEGAAEDKVQFSSVLQDVNKAKAASTKR